MFSCQSVCRYLFLLKKKSLSWPSKSYMTDRTFCGWVGFLVCFFVGNNCMGRLICPTGGTLVGVCTNIGECCAANGDYYHYYKNLCFFLLSLCVRTLCWQQWQSLIINLLLFYCLFVLPLVYFVVKVFTNTRKWRKICLSSVWLQVWWVKKRSASITFFQLKLTYLERNDKSRIFLPFSVSQWKGSVVVRPGEGRHR